MMDLRRHEWDALEPRQRGIASISLSLDDIGGTIGGLAGGTAGFFVGGPQGAKKGYEYGQKLGGGDIGVDANTFGLGATDTAALHEDTANARAAADQMHGAFNAYVPRDAPQMTGPAPIQARQADSYGATAQAAAGAAPVQAPQTNGTNAVGGQPVTAPTATAGFGRAATIAPTQLATGVPAAVSQAGAVGMNAAGINTAPSDQWRAGQQDLAGTLARTAAGQGPSVGVAQYRKSLGDIASQMAGQVAGARGNDRVFARREAMLHGGDLTAAAGLNEGLIRAQEAATAQGQLGNLQTGARGQDIGLATTAAGFRQGANAQNSQLGTQVSLANTAAQNAGAQFNAAQGADLSKFNAAAGNVRALTDAANTNDMTKFSAGEAGATSRFNAGQGLQAGEFNSGQATDLSKFNAGLSQQNQITNADRAMTGNLANMNATNDLSKFNAGMGTDVSKFNAGQDTGTAQFNAAQGNQVAVTNNAQQIQVATANLDAKLRQQGMDDNQRAQYIDAWLRAQGLTMQGDTGVMGAQQADAAGRRQITGQGIQALGSVSTLAGGA